MHILSKQQASRRWLADKGIGLLRLPKLTPPKLPDKIAAGKSLCLCLLQQAVVANYKDFKPQHLFAELGVTEGNLFGPQKL